MFINKKRFTISTLGLLMGAVIAIFIVGLLALGWYSFFKPRYANVERKMFENTKSYTHGKIQELGKYYREYRSAGASDQQTIRILIVSSFAEFDADKLNSPRLQNFLREMRGY